MAALFAVGFAVVPLPLALLFVYSTGGTVLLHAGGGEAAVVALLYLFGSVVGLRWMRRYEAVSMARLGCTFGKRLAGVRVVSFAGLPAVEPPSLRRSVARSAVPLGSGAVAALAGCVSVIWLDGQGLLVGAAAGAAAWAGIYGSSLWDPLRRGWHDKAAGTIVVRATDELLARLANPEPPIAALIPGLRRMVPAGADEQADNRTGSR